MIAFTTALLKPRTDLAIQKPKPAQDLFHPQKVQLYTYRFETLQPERPRYKWHTT